MSAEETDVLQMSNDFYNMFLNFHMKSNEKKKKDKSAKSKIVKVKSRLSVSVFVFTAQF